MTDACLPPRETPEPPRSFRILPVLDVLGGVTVRGVAGERSKYRPLVSRWTTSTNPVDVARAVHAAYGLRELYLADLDAIVHQSFNGALSRQLKEHGFRVLLDAGIRTSREAEAAAAAGVDSLVVGLETIEGPDELRKIRKCLGSERVVFSLDLKQGEPLGNMRRWNTSDPLAVADIAATAGIRRMIVLDLAAVGVGAGISTLPLCREIRRRQPQIELITGGGVRNMDDVNEARSAGMDAVLVASALHQGEIRPDSLVSISSSHSA